MKKAFTLVELIIIMCILGIIASIVVPTLANYTAEVKQSTAKDHLRTLRTFIEIYASNNEGVPPGYPDNDTQQSPDADVFVAQLASPGTAAAVIKFPENPFNGKKAIKVIGDFDNFPAAPANIDVYGWIYQPSTKTIRLNWSGIDNSGMSYFQY
jgi:type II secretory pathway pseudopilin PulG